MLKKFYPSQLLGIEQQIQDGIKLIIHSEVHSILKTLGSPDFDMWVHTLHFEHRECIQLYYWCLKMLIHAAAIQFRRFVRFRSPFHCLSRIWTAEARSLSQVQTLSEEQLSADLAQKAKVVDWHDASTTCHDPRCVSICTTASGTTSMMLIGVTHLPSHHDTRSHAFLCF